LEDIKMVFERVAKILASYKDVDASTIDIDASFGDLGLDSLDTVEIVMSLEDEFGIEIEMNESLKTVRDLVNLIEGK
jgi:acyl carrier protein